ncbi:unnamed protein product [Photorhabdus laumondii subsp. laumondii TTO1]|uniref:Photorhabdus luminescens subsp. laumondii TTO1 complete genome segment 10/17 n=1 Tax=Photorhabdus laumondii subsp. laumondii (strain DSM 15139 / CIP 105565 / TT01) TaxID=243265 RepID=Q7N375_PHOLL|nr:unnamed protein product [Photorhabdus laumondii subsp. laumondii TTO1]
MNCTPKVGCPITDLRRWFYEEKYPVASRIQVAEYFLSGTLGAKLTVKHFGIDHSTIVYIFSYFHVP